MWIVFGNSVKTARVPGGAKVERRCGQCGETATFYEKEITSTFRLYFMDVFDYQRHRVMACGCCGACYATDELGLPAQRDDREGTLGEGVGRAARRVGDTFERAADALGAGFSSLFSDEDPSAQASNAGEEDERSSADDDENDVLDDPLEARFRELERKAGLRTK